MKQRPYTIEAVETLMAKLIKPESSPLVLEEFKLLAKIFEIELQTQRAYLNSDVYHKNKEININKTFDNHIEQLMATDLEKYIFRVKTILNTIKSVYSFNMADIDVIRFVVSKELNFLKEHGEQN